jgi:hypothetical protein
MRWLVALLAWTLWLRARHRATLEATPRASDEASELALEEITLKRAEAVLEIELAAADVIDLKSVGLLTADVAALTILVAAHGQIDWWWAPAALMTISGVCFFLVLRTREWLLAPEFPEFRDEHVGKSRIEITHAMLEVVLECRETDYPFLEDKGKWFKRGYSTLALALVTLLIAALAMLPG